jgi:hypothetical protein
MKATLCMLATAVTLALVGAARADDSTKALEAKALFNEAVRKFKDQQYEAAVALFRRANEVNPTWKLLYNIGQCEATLRHYALALDAFEKYLEGGGAEITAERRAEIDNELKRLRALVGFLEVKGEPGDTVLIDGRDAGELPAASTIRLSVGKADVAVRRAGRTVLQQGIEINGGETTSIAAPADDKPSPAPAAAPAAGEPRPAASPAKAEEQPRVWTWVAVGVGGAAAVAGAVTGGLALAKRSDIDKQCSGNVCPSSARSEEDEAFTLAVATDALIGVAVLGIGTGVLLYFYEQEWLGESQVSAAPAAYRDGMGLSVSGRF